MAALHPEHTILVVDDSPENIALLCQVLESSYAVRVAASGRKALQIVFDDNPPDLILLDVIMPGIDGLEVCRRIKSNPDRRGIPILFVTSLGEMEDEALGLQLGAEDYIVKPISESIVLARIKTHLALYDQTRRLEHLVDIRTRELQAAQLEIILLLGRAAEFKDYTTGNHIIRMSHYCRLLGLAIGMGPAAVDILFHAAPMHDVGKIGIPDEILLKQGKLDPDEWKIMQRHAEIGAQILGHHEDELLAMAQVVALTHHEKWNGSGYPQGLKGEAIPLVGRIVAVADVFDALTSRRPYKIAWTVDQAITYIEDGAGAHFDPALIDPFKSVLPQIMATMERYSEEHATEAYR
jgi:putative two-component system response regulator